MAYIPEKQRDEEYKASKALHEQSKLKGVNSLMTPSGEFNKKSFGKKKKLKGAAKIEADIAPHKFDLGGKIPITNAQERTSKSYMGGGQIPSYEKGGNTNMLSKHSEHHSKKHMNEMKSDMKKGASFSESHAKALKKVGK